MAVLLFVCANQHTKYIFQRQGLETLGFETSAEMKSIPICLKVHICMLVYSQPSEKSERERCF